MPHKRARSTPATGANKPNPLEGLTAARFLEAANSPYRVAGEGGDRRVRLLLQWGEGEEERQEFEVKGKEFTSGSFGWTTSGKLTLPLALSGETTPRQIPCNFSCNLTIPGSKKTAKAAANPYGAGRASDKSQATVDSEDDKDDDDEETVKPAKEEAAVEEEKEEEGEKEEADNDEEEPKPKKAKKEKKTEEEKLAKKERKEKKAAKKAKKEAESE